MASCKRVLIIGLDCAAPELVFDKFAGKLPNLDRLREQGQWGRLESVIPPITVPAWACMMSGKDPGKLGIYGFRNRKSPDYDDLITVKSDAVKEPQLWDILGSIGASSVVVGVPPGYPLKPLRGVRVGCFLTPGTQGNDWAYPPSLVPEIREKLGSYAVDVADFRSDDKNRLLKEIFALNHRQFDVFEHLISTKPWQFAILVNIAVDRMHHAFWSTFDPRHHRYVAGNPLEGEMLRFYQEVDERLGRILQKLDDETAVMVVSDHGAKPIDGGICINEWLIQEGLLTLAGPKPDSPTPYAKVGIDWSKTKAWGEGGYYARISINKVGREPKGIVTESEFEAFRKELADRIRAIPDHEGKPLKHLIFKPEEIYPEPKGLPPDLIVHFGDLHWRSIGTIGHPAIHTFENDTGPDDANHAQHGIYVLRSPGIVPGQKDSHLLQIAPTVLSLLGKRVPKDMTRPSIC